MKRIYFIFFLILSAISMHGQKAIIFGTITDLETGMPVEFATVYIENSNNATESDRSGAYRLEIEAETKQRMIVSRRTFDEKQREHCVTQA